MLLGAEFVSELSDALGAILRDEDRDLAQPLRSWGSGRGPALVHQRAAADDAQHQSSRRSNWTETATRLCQRGAYAAATAGDETRFRSSEFTAVQCIEPISVTAPSITIVVIRA